MRTHEKGDIITHHQLYGVRQRRTLGEIDKVFQTECQRDMLVHLDKHAAIRRHFFGLLGLFRWLAILQVAEMDQTINIRE
jgi:hypothetical protein